MGLFLTPGPTGKSARGVRGDLQKTPYDIPWMPGVDYRTESGYPGTCLE